MFSLTFQANQTETRDIHPAWLIAGAIGYLFLLVVFNLLPERVGIVVTATDPDAFVPLLAPEFAVHLPWLNLYWGLGLILVAVNLYYLRWLPITHWADVGLSFLGIYVLFRLVLGGPIVGLDPAWVEQQAIAGASLVQLTTLVDVLDQIVKLGLSLALIVKIVGMVKKARYLQASPAPPRLKQA